MRTFFRAAVLAFLPCVAGAQEAMLPVPPKVVVEGVPPIPQSVADTLARYADFRSAGLVGWNPAKRQIVIVTRLGDVPQLYLVGGQNQPPVQITSEKDGVATSVWARFDPADPNTLVYRRDAQKGTEAFNLYKYDVAAGTTTLLTDGKSRYSVPPVTVPVWAHNGKLLAYDSTERNGRDRDVYVMQPSDPKTARRVVEDEGTWVPLDFSPEGTSLIVNHLVRSGSETYLWLVDLKTGDRKPFTPPDEQSYWDNARFSADGRSIYALSTRGAGNSRIWLRDPKGVWLPITKEEDTVSAFEIAPDGLRAALIYDRGSSDELQVIDLGTRKPRPLPSLPPGLLGNLAWRPGSSSEIGFTLQNPRTPGDVYSVDASLGTLTRWTTSPVGAFNPETLPPPEIISWKSFDGRTISGILYRPATKFTGARPVMINLHGGPLDRARPIFLGRGNYFLNELGIAVLYPNFRGSTGFGAGFTSLDDGKNREGVIKDVGAALDFIATRPGDFDKSRVMLTGGSYGGYLALESAIRYNDRIRCVFEGLGMTNLVTFLEETAPARQDDRRKEYGDERDPDMRAFLLSISPSSRVADLKKPVGIVHPGNDTRVAVSQARDFVNAVEKNGVPVWYVEFTDVGHDDFPRTQANYTYYFSAWIQFVKTYLVN